MALSPGTPPGVQEGVWKRSEPSASARHNLPRAGTSDEEVFHGLVEQHARMVFRLAFRITRNEADAEDVVQETFLKAYRAFDQYDSRASFSTWLFRIAANERRLTSRRAFPPRRAGRSLPG